MPCQSCQSIDPDKCKLEDKDMRTIVFALFTMLFLFACNSKSRADVSDAALATNVQDSESYASFLKKFLQDDEFCRSHIGEGFLVIKLLEHAYEYEQQTGVTTDSLLGYIANLKRLPATDSITEGIQVYGNNIVYVIAAVDMSWSYAMSFTKFNSDYELVNFAYKLPDKDLELKDNKYGIIEFLKNFTESASFRKQHLAATVTGKNYITRNAPEDLSYVWPKDQLSEMIDKVLQDKNMPGFVEQFYIINKDYAELVVQPETMNWGVIFAFKKIDGEWMLNQFVVSSAQFPPVGGNIVRDLSLIEGASQNWNLPQ